MTTVAIFMLLVAAASTIAFTPPETHHGPFGKIAVVDLLVDEIPVSEPRASEAEHSRYRRRASDTSSGNPSASSASFSSAGSFSGSGSGSGTGGSTYYSGGSSAPSGYFGVPSSYQQNPYNYVPYDFQAMFQQFFQQLQALSQQQAYAANPNRVTMLRPPSAAFSSSSDSLPLKIFYPIDSSLPASLDHFNGIASAKTFVGQVPTILSLRNYHYNNINKIFPSWDEYQEMTHFGLKPFFTNIDSFYGPSIESNTVDYGTGSGSSSSSGSFAGSGSGLGGYSGTYGSPTSGSGGFSGFPTGATGGSSSGDGTVGASAVANISPQGGYGSANIYPDLASRFGSSGGSFQPPSGNSFGVFTSSSSGSADVNGKKTSFKTATSGVNDNGKVTFYSAHDP